MQLRQLNDAQLSYCTNVHPGESLAAVTSLIDEHVLEVKRQFCPTQPFGVGLRLAAAAADELEQPGALEQFRDFLLARGLYVFTINGFPYGAFHGTRVKERVYLPDWLDPERVRYTQALARSLARLLPAGVSGSISTVPGCFRPRAQEEPRAEQRIAASLLAVTATLVELERATGQWIALALEPEPHCLLETTDEAVSFFERQLLGEDARALFAQLTGLSQSQAEIALRRHLGVCLDTCHASVEFESPLAAYRSLQRAGISVPKIQLSCGLRLPEANPERLEALKAFENDVYFHQTVVRTGTELERFVDLNDAFARGARAGSEWRVHFHVPIFLRELGVFESTQPDLLPLLAALATERPCPHLEVETYTWDVLPERFRNVPITSAIARELAFALTALGATNLREAKP